MVNQTLSFSKPSWTYGCSKCEWKGLKPENGFLYGNADCPSCGSSCTDDEESFEPEKEAV